MAANTESTNMSLKHLSLTDILPLTWKLLEDGVQRSADPFHTCALATVNRFGPTQRTVVLRHVDPEQHRVACHTDRRSGKARELHQNACVSWLFYDRKRKLQLHLGGMITIHTEDAFSDRCWAALPAHSRACYNTATRPGQSVSAPLAAPPLVENESEERTAREHFTVLACQVSFLDWLYLCASGHQRAQFQLRGERWEGGWVTP